jgi:putative ubiquitin-RnfH superfamily antitoxin RatB of RatAB toxin-antitoxin module
MNAPSQGLRITLVYAPQPRSVFERTLTLPAGACLQDALDASGVSAAHPALDLSPGHLGVWGRKADASQPLQDGDRVEVYRPLLVDPKVARRERFARQGARTTGLFAKKRAGAKAGY